MFGKQYANHLDILLQSFGEMNESYQEKVRKIDDKKPLIKILNKLYVLFLGIPEIGFQIRSLYFRKIIATHLITKNLETILDAGSGIGAYTFWVAEKFPRSKIIGGEIDRKKIISSTQIKKALKLKNVSFLYSDITKKQMKNKFNLVISIDILEHIHDYENVIKNFSYLLKREGYLYIHVPQPNQKRIFKISKDWHHNDHVREGISKKKLSDTLKTQGFKLISSKETFGFYGKLAWEINHFTLSKSFFLTGITYPFLYVLAQLDILNENKNGLGIAVLAQKK